MLPCGLYADLGFLFHTLLGCVPSCRDSEQLSLKNHAGDFLLSKLLHWFQLQQSLSVVHEKGKKKDCPAQPWQGGSEPILQRGFFPEAP